MTWDDDKSTATDPDNPSADEQLTADEWDDHVGQGHFPADELNLGVNGNGDPVMTDPQNADQEVLRYDRGAGQWVLSALTTDEGVYMGEVSQTPTDDDYSSGQIAFYAKSDGNLYKRPHGGTESQIGGGGGIFEDTDDDGIYEQQEGDGIAAPEDGSVEWGENNTRIAASNGNQRLNFSVNGQPFFDLAQDGGNNDMRMDVPIRVAGRIYQIPHADFSAQDVRNLSSPSQGWTAYHDGSGSNTEGPTHYNGTDWISTVDGSTIS